jgi:hypothetical protein
MPAQRIEQLLVALLAVACAILVSSLRNTSVPLVVCRADAQLKSTVRMSPPGGSPGGEGQKRTRTAEPEAVVGVGHRV